VVALPFPAKTLSRLGDWIAQGRAVPGPPWPLNLPLIAALLVSPVPLAALVFQEVSFILWGVLIGDLLLLFVFATATARQPAFFIGIVVLWFALQRFVVALIAPHVSADVVRLLLTYKEGFYLILFAAAALTTCLRYLSSERALPPLLLADAVAVAFLGLLALHFVSSPDTSSPELTYFRRFGAPVLLYLGGRLLIPSRAQFQDSLRIVVAVALGVAFFGIIERFALDVAFWRDGVDAATFYSRQVESGLVPHGWIVIYRGVPDGIFIGLPLEVPVRRLVSTYLEPTTLSSFLALALLLLLLVPDHARMRPFYRVAAIAGVALLALAVLATLSRGGMLTVGAGITLFALVAILRPGGHLRDLPYPPLLLGLLAVMGLGFGLTTFANVPAREQVRDVLSTRAVSGLSPEPTAAPVDATLPAATPGPAIEPPPLEEIIVHPPGSTADAANKHLGGLTSGLEEMVDHPLGRGLGAAGNWSRTPEVGGESTVGVLSAQLGVPGFLLFVAFFGAVIATLVQVYWRSDNGASSLTLAIGGALFGLFIVSWVSESASGLLGNAFYFLFAGWALGLASPATERPRLAWMPPAPSSSSRSIT